MNHIRFPTLFISHGGGPWPYIEDMRQRFAITAAELERLPATLPAKPKAILVITGHWEAPQFTVSTAEHPPMEYDYYGFPEHTYHVKYPASGIPFSILEMLAAEVPVLNANSSWLQPRASLNLLMTLPNSIVQVIESYQNRKIVFVNQAVLYCVLVKS